MLKTRSLYTCFNGKTDIYGTKYGNYHHNLFMPDNSYEGEKAVTFCKEYGLARAGLFQPTVMQGIEKFISTERKYKDNYCYHVRQRSVNLPWTSAYRGYWSDANQLWCSRTIPHCRITGYWALPTLQEGEAWYEECLSMVDDGLRAEAYWALKPKFEGEVSLLNFLYELKDFRDIAKLLTRRKRNPLRELSDALAGYKQSQNAINDGINKAVKDKFSKPTKSVAEGHLLYAFAIKPLIKDLTEIFKQLHATVDDAEKTFLENGKGTRRYWSKTLQPVANLTPNGSDMHQNYWVGLRKQGNFTVKANMTYDYTPRSRFNAFCAYWGLVPTAEAVWNGLPFSFLVDYFLSVGKSLKYMRTDPNLSNYHILEYSESIASEIFYGRYLSYTEIPGVTFGIDIDGSYYSSIPDDAPKQLEGSSCSFYKRELRNPYWGPALPKFRKPNTNQLLNMAALARCMLDSSR